MSEFEQPPPYVQYPRSNFQPSGEFDRPPGVYFDAIADAWELVKRDLGTWIAMFLLSGIVGILIAAPFHVVSAFVPGGQWIFGQPINPGPFAFANFIVTIGHCLAFPAYAGIYYAALKQIRGEPLEIGNVFRGFSHFVSLAGFGLLYNLLVSIACLLCGFPAFFAIGICTPCFLLIMDRGLGPIAAIKESVRVLGGQAWMLGLFAVVALIALALLGIAMCCVGMLITLPVWIVATTLHYHYFWPTQTTQPVVPPMEG